MMDSFTALGFPQYSSHKVVRAAKIREIIEDHQFSKFPILLTFEPGPGAINPPDYRVPLAWVKGKRAEVGGYFVIYDDGYTSYSPCSAFESGYNHIPEGETDAPQSR